MLLLPYPCLGGGGGGGIIDARLFGVLADDIGGEDMSILATLGGRPEMLLLLPLAGGTGGNPIADVLVSGK